MLPHSKALSVKSRCSFFVLPHFKAHIMVVQFNSIEVSASDCIAACESVFSIRLLPLHNFGQIAQAVILYEMLDCAYSPAHSFAQCFNLIAFLAPSFALLFISVLENACELFDSLKPRSPVLVVLFGSKQKRTHQKSYFFRFARQFVLAFANRFEGTTQTTCRKVPVQCRCIFFSFVLFAHHILDRPRKLFTEIISASEWLIHLDHSDSRTGIHLFFAISLCCLFVSR